MEPHEKHQLSIKKRITKTVDPIKRRDGAYGWLGRNLGTDLKIPGPMSKSLNFSQYNNKIKILSVNAISK